MSKTRWYRPKSKINTNKKEAERIAKELRNKPRYKTVQLQKRILKADKKTETPSTKGYWIKVSTSAKRTIGRGAKRKLR